MIGHRYYIKNPSRWYWPFKSIDEVTRNKMLDKIADEVAKYPLKWPCNVHGVFNPHAVAATIMAGIESGQAVMLYSDRIYFSITVNKGQ